MEKAKRHTLTCQSIDGSTRFSCEKLLYSDDLVSGIEALSKRDWTSCGRNTRMIKSRKAFVRGSYRYAWSVHDPIGRLERMYGDDPRRSLLLYPPK